MSDQRRVGLLEDGGREGIRTSGLLVANDVNPKLRRGAALSFRNGSLDGLFGYKVNGGCESSDPGLGFCPW